MFHNFLRDLAKRFQSKPSTKGSRRLNKTFRPRLEILEEREVPAITLSGMTTFAVGSSPYGNATADLNGDGKADLIQANNTSATISVLLNTTAAFATTPTFSAQQTFAVGNGPYFVAVGDVNGDGKADLAVVNSTSATVSVLLNTTAVGAFSASFSAQQTLTVGTTPVSVSFADVNSDGKVDIVSANNNVATISVLLNTTATGATTPSFAAHQTFTVGTNPYASVAVGDVNGDGRVDLAVANYGSANVSVLLNTTTPGSSTVTFAAQTTFTVGAGPAYTVLTDLNGDGKLDLAVSNYGLAVGTTISVLLNTTANGGATPTFSAQQTFAVGNNPFGIAVGDYDGDGRNDLAVGNANNPGTISLLLNTTANGAGAAAFAAQQTFSAGNVPYYPLAADFNNDGRTDIAVANASSNNIGVFLNTTAFAGQRTFATGSGPNAVAIGDFNGDGRPDLATANYNDNTVSVLLNTAASGALPTYAPQQTYFVGTNPYEIAIGDLNGDGRPDLVTANSGNGTVGVLLNATPTGAATTSFTLQPALTSGSTPRGVALADFNGDGRLDVVATSSIGAGTVSVMLNNTPLGASIAVFAAAQTFSVGNTPYSVVVGDVNADGRPDIAVVNFGSNNLSVLLNTTATGAVVPSFAAQQTFATGTSPYGVAFGDFNGDGRPDLATSNFGSNNVSVLLNTTARAATTPTFATASTFTVGTNPLSIAVGDLDGDGRPDIAVANQGTATASVLLNTTAYQAITPTFAAQQTQTAGAGARGAAIADLNNDGRNDIVVANSTDNNVSVIRGQLTGSVGATNIIAAFPGAGIYRHNQSNGVWTQLGGGTPNLWAVDAYGDFVASFAVGGTYLYRPSTGFIQISGATALALAMSSNGLIVAAFNGYGLAEYRQDGSSWRLLTPAIPNTLAVNSLGQIACSFPGGGTYFYRQTTGFIQISLATPSLLVIDDLSTITASYSGGTYIFRQTGGFQLIHSLQANVLAVNGDGKLIIEFAGYGVFSYIPATGYRGIYPSNGSRVAVDRWGNTFASFAGYGCWYLDPVAGWQQFGTGNPSAVVVG